MEAKKAGTRVLTELEETLLEVGVFASMAAGKHLRAGGYPPPTESQARAINRGLRRGIAALLIEVGTGSVVENRLPDVIEGLAGAVVLDVMGPPSPNSVN